MVDLKRIGKQFFFCKKKKKIINRLKMPHITEYLFFIFIHI